MHSEINRGLTAIGSNTEALLCQALTAELRRLAVDPEACGNTLAWLLAQLLPDQRLDLDDVVGLWDYGRAARRGVSRA